MAQLAPFWPLSPLLPQVTSVLHFLQGVKPTRTQPPYLRRHYYLLHSELIILIPMQFEWLLALYPTDLCLFLTVLFHKASLQLASPPWGPTGSDKLPQASLASQGLPVSTRTHRPWKLLASSGSSGQWRIQVLRQVLDVSTSEEPTAPSTFFNHKISILAPSSFLSTFLFFLCVYFLY